MQRLFEIILVCVVMYVVYALTVKNWDYHSEAKRKELRLRFKELGMSNVFFFTGTLKLFTLNILSGGFFVFYWLYMQWKAVLSGFQRLSRRPLKYGPVWRAVFFFISVYQLGGIINRTCIYMRKTPNLPAWFWGTAWIVSFIGLFVFSSVWAKTAAYLLFCAVPAFIQRRLNALPESPIPNTPKPAEIIAAVCGLLLTLGLAAGWRVFFQ